MAKITSKTILPVSQTLRSGSLDDQERLEDVDEEQERLILERIIANLVGDDSVGRGLNLPEQRLWLSVLMQAFSDLHYLNQHKKKMEKRLRKDAERWLLNAAETGPGSITWIAEMLGIKSPRTMVKRILNLSKAEFRSCAREIKSIIGGLKDG